MTNHLHPPIQDHFPKYCQIEEIPECLLLAFSIREWLNNLFNNSVNWSSFLLKFCPDNSDLAQSSELKQFSSNFIQMILWFDPRISEAGIVRWSNSKKGTPHFIVSLKLCNCKPLRLHIRLEGAGNNKVQFWI